MVAEPSEHDGRGGMMSRIAKLESDVAHIQSDVREIKLDLREIRQDVKDIRIEARRDFRLLFGSLIGVAVGLAALMAKSFGWIH
jgi:hypothetical protein